MHESVCYKNLSAIKLVTLTVAKYIFQIFLFLYFIIIDSLPTSVRYSLQKHTWISRKLTPSLCLLFIHFITIVIRMMKLFIWSFYMLFYEILILFSNFISNVCHICNIFHISLHKCLVFIWCCHLFWKSLTLSFHTEKIIN